MRRFDRYGSLARPRATIFGVLLLLALVAGACRDAPDEPASRERAALTAFLERRGSDESEIVRRVRRFYEARDHELAWSTSEGLRAPARVLIRRVAAAHEEGLEPAAYGADVLERKASAIDTEESSSWLDRVLGWLGVGGEPPPVDRRVELDVLLTDAFLSHASDLAVGRVAPAEVGADLKVPDDRFDPVASLERALVEGVEEEIERLRPPHPEYAALTEALARYRELASNGGWSAPTPGPGVKPGEPLAAERRRSLVRRLAAEGFAEEALADGPAVLDEPLAKALRRFQSLRGIEPDGVLGDRTVAELAVPAATRVDQIRWNLERWRWLPTDLGRRHVRVNTAAFTLGAYEDGKQVLTMKVVVGKQGAETPLFSDQMERVVLNPYWNVPQGIAKDEIVAGSSPAALAKKGYELVSTSGEPLVNGDWSAVGSGARIRQKPGPSNALGQIKFLFPNSHQVYLHDTPQDHLFARTDRAFSHGCIRLEKPLALAETLLGGAGWNRERLEQALATSETKQIELDEEVPVYILYWTALVNADGEVEFHQDLYGVDERLARALGERGGGRAPAPASARSSTR